MTSRVSNLCPNDDILLESIMRATGLSREQVESLSLMDDELDELCDAALAEINGPQNR